MLEFLLYMSWKLQMQFPIWMTIWAYGVHYKVLMFYFFLVECLFEVELTLLIIFIYFIIILKNTHYI